MYSNLFGKDPSQPVPTVVSVAKGGYVHLFKFNEDQHRRDKDGKFTSGGAGGATPEGTKGKKRVVSAEVIADSMKAANALPPKPPRPKEFTQPHAATSSDLMETARNASPMFDKLMSKISKSLKCPVVPAPTEGKPSTDTGTGVAVLMGPMKKQAKVEDKAWDYAKENNGNPDFSKIGDILRSTVAVDNLEDIPRVLDVLRKAGVVVSRDPKVRLDGTGAGYRDVMMNVTLPNGHVAEIQVNTRAMLDAKNGAGNGHGLYNQQNKIFADAKKVDRPLTVTELREVARLDQKQKAVYGAAWTKSGGT